MIAFVSISCSNSDDSNEITGLQFDQQTFDANLQSWKGNGFSNYTFSQEYFSTAVGPPQPVITSVVKDNNSESVTISSNYNGNLGLDEMTYYQTIDDVFAYIEQSIDYYQEQIDSSENSMTGVEIHVAYDETYNFPTKLELMGHYSEPLLGGLSITIIFSGFEEI